MKVRRTHKAKNLFGLQQLSICLVTLVLSSSINTMCIADVPEKPAPPEIAARALVRGEKFLRDVQRLSPVIDIADRDRSQMWPRMSSWSRRLPDQDKPIVIERSKMSSVVTNIHSDSEYHGASLSVRFHGREIQMVMDPQCTQVRAVIDSVLDHALQNDPPPPLNECIDGSNVLRRSVLYLKAGGIDVNSLTLIDLQQTDSSNPPRSASERSWSAYFMRHWSGIPFIDEQLFVTLDAGKGRLITYGGASLVLAPPTNTSLSVTSEQAVQLAEAKCREMGLTPADGSYASLVIALPSDINGDHEKGNKPQLCWSAYIPLQSPGNIQPAHIVRVNVTTGEIIGGHRFRSRGQGVTGLADPIIMKLLSNANKLEVASVNANSTSVVVKPITMKLRYLGALNGFMGPKSTDMKIHASHDVAVYPAQGKPRAFKYDASTGLLQDEAGKGVIVSMPMRAILTSH